MKTPKYKRVLLKLSGEALAPSNGANILDFDFIENGAIRGYDKSYEWYGAFGLMVTLVWLYVELLELLAKISRR